MSLIFIAILGAYQVLLFFVHAAVYRSFSDAFGWNFPWLAWLFSLLSLSFVTASVLSHRFCNSVISVFYAASAYWFGLIHFLLAGALGLFFSEYILYNHNYYVSPAILAEIWFGAMFLIHTYATWQTGRPKLTRITVPLPHINEHWRGKKIIFVSDIHLGNIWGAKFSARIADKIKQESPEIVLVGGDIFDGVRCHSIELIKPFFNLRPPQGVFFISGNHEYIENTIASFSEIDREGMRILKNEMVDVYGMQIAGVDWKDARHPAEFAKFLAEMHIDPKKPSILMRHEPNHLEVAERAGISLELSGHTHAGQIFPLSYITRKMYKGFDYGLKKLGDMMVYTSSGVGTWGPPLRFGTISEIVVITLA